MVKLQREAACNEIGKAQAFNAKDRAAASMRPNSMRAYNYGFNVMLSSESQLCHCYCCNYSASNMPLEIKTNFKIYSNLTHNY